MERYRPLSARHLLLIAPVLRLRVSPWSLMHMRNNVFACSHALFMGREEATVLWWTLSPRSCVSLSYAHLCVSWIAFSHTVKSAHYQTPTLLLQSKGALHNKHLFWFCHTGHRGFFTVWQRLTGLSSPLCAAYSRQHHCVNMPPHHLYWSYHTSTRAGGSFVALFKAPPDYVYLCLWMQ